MKTDKKDKDLDENNQGLSLNVVVIAAVTIIMLTGLILVFTEPWDHWQENLTNVTCKMKTSMIDDSMKVAISEDFRRERIAGCVTGCAIATSYEEDHLRRVRLRYNCSQICADQVGR